MGIKIEGQIVISREERKYKKYDLLKGVVIFAERLAFSWYHMVHYHKLYRQKFNLPDCDAKVEAQ